jgi:hypothetical protein
MSVHRVIKVMCVLIVEFAVICVQPVMCFNVHMVWPTVRLTDCKALRSLATVVAELGYSAV